MSNHNQAAADLHADQRVRFRPSAERTVSTHDLAKLFGKSQRSHRRYLRYGPPEVKEFLEYAWKHPEAFRVVADLLTKKYQLDLREKSVGRIIQIRQRTILDNKRSEAEDTCDDLDPKKSWSERSLSSKRDGCTDFKKAACEDELDWRGVPTDLAEVHE